MSGHIEEILLTSFVLPFFWACGKDICLVKASERAFSPHTKPRTFIYRALILIKISTAYQCLRFPLFVHSCPHVTSLGQLPSRKRCSPWVSLPPPLGAEK